MDHGIGLVLMGHRDLCNFISISPSPCTLILDEISAITQESNARNAPRLDE
jgi:hypothetical protein